MSESSRLRWRCRRGMRELDVVLVHYLDKHYPAVGEDRQAAFRELLEQQDPELLAWFTGRGRPEKEELADVVDAIRAAYRSGTGG